MLRKTQVASIMSLVSMLHDRNVHLVAFSDTRFGELVVSANTQLSDIENQSVDGLLLKMTGAVATKEVDHEGRPITLISDHSRIKSDLVKTMAAGVRRVIKQTHGVVIPAIKTVSAEISGKLAESSSLMSITPETTILSFDPIWASVTVDGIATRHAQIPETGIPESLQLPELTNEQIDALIAVGGSEFSKFINEYKERDCINALYDAWFRGVVGEQRVFCREQVPGGYSVGKLITTPENIIDFKDDLLIAYALANNLLDHPPAGTKSESLDKYNEDISAVLNHVGKLISQLYYLRETWDNTGLLVMKFPDVIDWVNRGAKGELILNGDVYKRYLTKGDIETVLGSIYSKNPSNNANTILELATSYKANWLKVVDVFNLTDSNRHQQKKLTLITDAVINHIRGINDDVWASYQSDNGGRTKGQVINSFTNMLTRITPTCTSLELDEFLINVFSELVYPGRHVGEFLRRMNNYPDQTLEPKVIASRVVMEILVDDLLGQISFERQ